MGKVSIKRMSCLLFGIMAVAIVAYPNTVNAAKDSQGDFHELVDVDYSPNLNSAVDEVTLTVNNHSDIKWKIYYAAPNAAVDDSGDIDYTFFFNKSGNFRPRLGTTSLDANDTYSKKIEFNQDKEVVFAFITVDGTQQYNGKTYNECKLKFKNDEIKFNNSTCTGYYRTITSSAATYSNTHDVTDKVQCDAMRAGRYRNDPNKTSANDIKAENIADYQARMKAYFPYCFAGNLAPVQFSGPYIREVRQSFIKYYNERKKFESKVRDNSQYDAFLADIGLYQQVQSAGLKNGVITKDVKTIVNGGNALTCRKDAVEEDTQKYYATNKIVDNSFCSVTCTEKLSVTYSPPSAVKAGLCFQYQVTVKSIVKCKTEVKPNNDWPKNQIPAAQCKITAKCSGGTDQAGPNEEFDSCIKKCDGGKYSQKCIDKCYVNTYDNESKSSTQAINITEDSSDIKFMANRGEDEEDPYVTYKEKNDVKKKCYTKDKMLANIDFCAEAFYKAKQAEPNGKYVHESGKKYLWKPNNQNYKKCNVYNNSSCRNDGRPNSILKSIKRAAPYYLRDRAATKELLYSFFGMHSGTNGYGQARYYIIDNGGIKRQYTASYKCNEECWFTRSKTNKECPGDASDIEDSYPSDALDAKTAEIEECNNAEENNCSTTTATYTIGANKPEEYNQGTNKPGNEGRDAINRGSGDKIFAALDEMDLENGVNGICYGIERPEWYYKTTISFPDSYINRKTGDIINTKTNPTGCQGNSEDGSGTCLVKKFYYCTPYNMKSVNPWWWEWKLIKQGQGTAPNPEVYNIQARVGYDKNDKEEGGFGKFGWKLKVACFYAVYNCVDPNDPNCPYPKNSATKDECTGDGCTVLNNEVRTVDPKDPFNQNKNNTTSSSSGVKPTKREIGFNWTKDAQIKYDDKDLETRGYKVNPEDYLKEIQSIAEQGRTYDDSYVDFEITLDPQQLNELKKYANEKTVNAFEGKYTAIGDKKTLSVYRSTLLDKYNPIKRSQTGINNE